MVLDIDRRGFLALAGLGLGLGLPPSTNAKAASENALPLRAIGTHTRLPAWLGGNTFIAAGTRSFVHFPRPVRRFKLVVPTFTVRDGPPVADADLSSDMNFQFGIDEAATPSLLDVPARRLVTFGGDTVARYRVADGPFGCLVSDWFKLLAPRRSISLFSVQEWAGGVAVASGHMPRNTAIGAGVAGFHEILAHSTQSMIGSGWAADQASFGLETTDPLRGFTPYIVAEFDHSEISVLLLGSSTAAGIGETIGGTGTYRPNRGDIYGNRGWLERWLHRGPGIAFGNLSKGGDRLKDHSVPRNIARRLTLAKVLNPTHAALQLGPNDFAGSTFADMQANAVAIKTSYNAQIDGLQWIGVTAIPRSSSKENAWLALDGSDQTPRKGSGAGSNHEHWNTLIRKSEGCFSDQIGYLDPCLYVEMAPLGSSKCVADGVTPKLMTGDGIHLTGDGSERIVTGLGKDRDAFS